MAVNKLKHNALLSGKVRARASGFPMQQLVRLLVNRYFFKIENYLVVAINILPPK